MAEEKQTKLSIIVRTVDQATAKIKAISDRLDKVTKPVRDFKEALGELRSNSGLDDVIGGFKGVGSAIGDVLAKVAMVGGVVALAVGGVFHLVNEFDDLGKKAARAGVSVDFLAALRDAAERTGVPIEALDDNLDTFNVNLGKARAGTGRMAKFLPKVSTNLHADFGASLLRQLTAAKDTTAAFDVLADAMSKLTNPEEREALAAATFGDPKAAQLLMKGSKGIKEMGAHYLGLAKSQEGAAKAAEEVHEKMADFKAVTDGIKASIVKGLAPALGKIVEQLSAWFEGHQKDVEEWAAAVGERLPDAFNAVVDAVGDVIDTLEPFFNSTTKIKIAIGVLAAIMVGPLVSAIATLGIAILTTPVGWILGGLAALGLGAYELIKHWDAVSDFFTGLWDGVKGTFEDAYDDIKSIVDKITGLVDGLLGDDFGGVVTLAKQQQEKEGGPALGGVDQAIADMRKQRQQRQSQDALAPNGLQGAIKVDVNFTNAPKGTRVKTESSGNADVDLMVGHATGWMPS